MTLNSSGNLGIGTTSPDAPLTIHNSSDPEIRFGYNASQDHRISWDSSKVYIHADPENANNNSALALNVDGNERLYINNSGEVGIGLTAPLRRLHVKSGANNNDGAFRVESSSGNIMDMGTDGTGHFINCVNTDPLRVKFAGTEEIRFQSGGGISFNGDTATANALDDYEEGSWTPVLTFGGGATGITYQYRTGKYVKIGGIVILKFGFRLSSNGSSTGGARVEGLPYNGVHSAYYHDSGALITVDGGSNTTDGHTNCFVTDTNQLALRQGGTGNQNTDATNAMFNNNTSIFGTVTYSTVG